MYQWDDPVSDTRAFPTPIETTEGNAAGGVHEIIPLERLPSKRAIHFLDSSLGGLHGDIGRGSGVLKGMEFSGDAGDPGSMSGEKKNTIRCILSIKAFPSWLCHTGSAPSDCDWRKAGKRGCDGGGDGSGGSGGDGMVTPCGDRGNDLVVAAIGSMRVMGTRLNLS